MFKLTHPLPRKYWIAVSGGIDSMSVLDWLRKPSRTGLLGVVHIDHGTEHAKDARRFVESFCEEQGVKCLTFEIKDQAPKGESKEAWWRDRRYEIFKYQVPGQEEIILGHHFDDCLEEYLMNVMIRGFMDVIGYRNGRCIRPFRLWKKKDIIDYSTRKKISFVSDPSNNDTRFKRNHIRKNIAPEVLKLNPGIYNIVKKLILAKIDSRLCKGCDGKGMVASAWKPCSKCRRQDALNQPCPSCDAEEGTTLNNGFLRCNKCGYPGQ